MELTCNGNGMGSRIRMEGTVSPFLMVAHYGDTSIAARLDTAHAPTKESGAITGC